MPPFEAVNPDAGVRPMMRRPGFAPAVQDSRTFRRMPRALRRDHAAAVAALDADPTGKPCLWFDAVTGLCRHYRWRPAVCRVFAVGGKLCRRMYANPDAVMQWSDRCEPRYWRDPSDGGRWRRPNRWHLRTGWRGWAGLVWRPVQRWWAWHSWWRNPLETTSAVKQSAVS